jgi:hypothetical protein
MGSLDVEAGHLWGPRSPEGVWVAGWGLVLTLAAPGRGLTDFYIIGNS